MMPQKSRELKDLEERYYHLKCDYYQATKPALFSKYLEMGSAAMKRAWFTPFKETNAKELQKSVVAMVHVAGGYAWQIDVKGNFDQKTGKWRTTQMTKGVPDVEAVIGGLYYAFEIKYGSDKQSDDQKDFERKVKKAGGKYHIVKTFADAHKVLFPFVQMGLV